MAVIPPAWTLISLRPQGQHDALRQAARKVGASLLAASVVRLQPQQAPQALRAALACPVRIATSPAAVRSLQRHGPYARPALRLYTARYWKTPKACCNCPNSKPFMA